jgi:hypothetical protein
MSKIETHYININELSETLEWMVDQYWYINMFHHWSKNQGKKIDSLITKLTPDGKLNGTSIPEEGIVKGIWRMPFGWDDESTQRRAPLVWDVFDKINKQFFNNEFTLDGYGEGIRATRSLWQHPNHKDLPEWGTQLKPGYTPEIWTCYANARPNGMHCHGNLPEQKSNAHMDSDGDPDPDTYTILVNLNPKWKPNSGGEVIFHKLGDDEHIHGNKPYGVGYAEKIIPHEPGLVILYSSDYIHRTIPNVVANSDERFQQKLAFRVRKK